MRLAKSESQPLLVASETPPAFELSVPGNSHPERRICTDCRASGVGATANLEYTVTAPANSSSTCSVYSIFENSYVKKGVKASNGVVTFTDSLRGYATIAYRIECDSDELRQIGRAHV